MTHPSRREPPAATCKHIGERPTKMYAEDDEDQYGDEDDDRDFPRQPRRILPARPFT
jgi:hypothetical protein